ncbi:class I SAM-dependent methyltransferase [Candidatus Methylocalor cossyra]|uniref:class I SAM-dependent methyltransferase n=1 Tax=Candidatus Methylocalor cossyra TaxID=3108543 RepID=UPI0032B1A9C5
MKTKSTQSSHPRRAFLEWYHVTTLGQILQKIEAYYLQSELKLTYNQKILQVGTLGSESLYVAPDLIRNWALVNTGDATPHPRLPTIAAAADALPVASESIDALILPHVIEFDAHQRHGILQEVERVLVPEGRLYILGFNPWSLHGVIQRLPCDFTLWRGKFVSRHRLLDWLSQLKFDAEFSAAFSLSSSEVLSQPNTLWARTRAELSFAYALKAVKRRYTLIPVEPCWAKAPRLAAGNLVLVRQVKENRAVAGA